MITITNWLRAPGMDSKRRICVLTGIDAGDGPHKRAAELELHITDLNTGRHMSMKIDGDDLDKFKEVLGK